MRLAEWKRNIDFQEASYTSVSTTVGLVKGEQWKEKCLFVKKMGNYYL